MIPATARQSHKYDPWICALLFVTTIIVFSRALQCDFVNYDDPSYVTDNPYVKAGLSWHGIVWAFTGRTDYWHPLSWLTHMVDWQFYGPRAAGHHLTSLVWHACNSVLAFLLMRKLAGGVWLAAFAAAVFAWHTLRVESVVWITERKDVVSGFFFLLSLLVYLRYAEQRASGKTARGLYSLVLVLFLAGLMGKPMVVTLPAVLLLLDVWPLGRCVSFRQLCWLVVEKGPFFLLSAAVSVLTIVMQKHEGAFVLDLGLDARVGNAVVSIARYLGKYFWPDDLIVCYAHPGYWPASFVVAATLLVGAITGLAVWQWKRRPWIAAGWGWFLITLLPAIGLIQVGFQSMGDRYTYLPMLGVGFGLLWSLPPLLERLAIRKFAIFAGVAVVTALVLRTWKQQAVWRDSVSLFEHAVHVSEGDGKSHDFLASAYYSAERFEEAAIHAEKACALDVKSDTPRLTLAGIRTRQGRIEEAKDLYREALRFKPTNADASMELGLLEFGTGHAEEARRIMIQALRGKPLLRNRTVVLGKNALEQNDPKTGLFLFETVAQAFPEDAEANAIAGKLLMRLKRADQAIHYLRAATRMATDDFDALIALARAAEELDRKDEATAAMEAALAGAAENAAISQAGAEFYAWRRDFGRAIHLAQRSASLSPANAEYRVSLGYLLLITGNREAGLAEWRQALELAPDFPGLRERFDAEAAKH